MTEVDNVQSGTAPTLADRRQWPDMSKVDKATLQGQQPERRRDASVPLTCPLCHHPAVEVLSVDDSVGTIQVQCTGCLQGSTLSCEVLNGDGTDDC